MHKNRKTADGKLVEQYKVGTDGEGSLDEFTHIVHEKAPKVCEVFQVNEHAHLVTYRSRPTSGGCGK
jgi:hypothetical protein